MRTVKMVDLITLSVERTKLILFQPFVLKKWLKLLFIAILAGAVSGGGWGSGSSGSSSNKAEAALENIQDVSAGIEDQAPGPAVTPERIQRPSKEFKEVMREIWKEASEYPPGTLAAVITLSVILLTGLIVVMSWLSARFKFIWLHAVIHNEAVIKKPFHEYRKEGNSIFKLSIVVGLLVLAFMGLFVFWIAGSAAWAGIFKGDVAMTAGALTSLIAAVIVFIAAIVVVAIWNVYVEHFVVPIMMIDRQTYLPSWDKFSAIYKNQRGEFWVYLLVFFGLGIVCSILEGIVFLGVLLAGGLLGALIYGIGYLIFALLLKAKILFIGFAIGAGIPLAIVFVVILLSIVLPCAVFFRAFALYFLTSLNEGYAPLAIKES